MTVAQAAAGLRRLNLFQARRVSRLSVSPSLSDTQNCVSGWTTPVPLCLLSVCESERRAVALSWVGTAVMAAEGGEKAGRNKSSEKLGKTMHGGGQTLGFSQILRWSSVFKTWKAPSLSLYISITHILFSRA